MLLALRETHARARPHLDVVDDGQPVTLMIGSPV